jgi:hypothetical protein
MMIEFQEELIVSRTDYQGSLFQSTNARAIFFELADRHQFLGVKEMTVKEISEVTFFSIRTVRRQIALLEKLGFLNVDVRRGVEGYAYSCNYDNLIAAKAKADEEEAEEARKLAATRPRPRLSLVVNNN